MLFLDTCVVVDILRGGKDHYLLNLREAEAAGRQLTISSFVLHELTYGAMTSVRPDLHLNLLDAFIARAHIEPSTAEDAIAAARIRTDLQATGAPIGAVDSLIAGQAVNRGWSLVTSNLRDFVRVADLTVIDWSDPAGPREINQATRTAWMLTNLRRPLKEAK
ncbi:MAG: PIN domain-containing protein [Caulobacteraceae bacterium]